jgi:hypothetical protein
MAPRLMLLLALLAPRSLPAQTVVDTSGAGTLIAQAMDHSEVMSNLQHLSDVIGPRLTGSAAMRRANDWAAERFRQYGLVAKLEPYQFGVTWERGEVSLRLLEPFTRWVTGQSWAWTAGTGGRPLAGPVVLTDLTTPESLAVYRSRVKGAWVLPRSAYPLWNPDGPAMTPEDSIRLAEKFVCGIPSLPTPPRPPYSPAGSSRLTCPMSSRLRARWAPSSMPPRTTRS